METKLAKLSVTTDAEQALDRMLQNANEGFSGGRISKPQLASWILLCFENKYFSKHRGTIQHDYFDQMVYLDFLMKEAKRARKEGGPIPDVTALIAKLNSARAATPPQE